MQNDTYFNLTENGFTAQVFNSESTFVLDESGGLACRPLYIILISNLNTKKSYRLSNICFYSQCHFNNDESNTYFWTDAEAAAKKLAEKIQAKGVVNLSLWQQYAP